MLWNQLFKLVALFIFPCTVLAASPVAQSLAKDQQKIGVATFTQPDYKPGLIRHIVLFKYRPSVTPKQRDEIKRRFLALQTECMHDGKPYIQSIETGSQMSGEGADLGLEQGFIVTFSSEGDRNYYVGTPVVTDPSHYESAHAAFKRFVAPFLAKVVVFDFNVEGKS